MSNENMEDQIRALTELVTQLQADNTRLREAATPQPVQQVVLNPESSSTIATNPVVPPVERVYIQAPRERKCARFSGKMSQDAMTVEDWVEEARRSLASRHMTSKEQASFLYDLLDGEAKREVKFSSREERENPDSILAILQENFGCSKSYVVLQKQFFQRRQQEGESIRQYSHALAELMELLKSRDPRGVSNPDLVLRDQFIENVREDLLHRELFRSVQQTPRLTFREVRNEALKWGGRNARSSVPRARAHSCESQSVAESEEVDSNAVYARPKNELAELKEGLRKQQAQLDAILKHLRSGAAVNSTELQGN